MEAGGRIYFSSIVNAGEEIMSLNHHLLAKQTTDAVLMRFKSGDWHCCNNIGEKFYRVGCDSTFPSPDAAFFDDENKIFASFEFKPPTETKRGILTGLGQSIAYLNFSNLSFLVIPEYLEDFNIGSYMENLYSTKIKNSLPIGLVVYSNNAPENVTLKHEVVTANKDIKSVPNPGSRFWAKHQDLPIPLFHFILRCFYLKKVNEITEDAFKYCWDKFLAPKAKLRRLEVAEIKDVSDRPIQTLAGRKNIAFFEKRINKIKTMPQGLQQGAIDKLLLDADSDYVGDNMYNSVRKNFLTFMRHIGMIDSTNNITENGVKLYHLGMVNGPMSKIFINYFTQTVLLAGHHIDLIYDLDKLSVDFRGTLSTQEIKSKLEEQYNARGMIKFNPNRRRTETSSVEFLKYEFILWNSLGLLIKSSGKPDLAFNWKLITEICSLPEL